MGAAFHPRQSESFVLSRVALRNLNNIVTSASHPRPLLSRLPRTTRQPTYLQNVNLSDQQTQLLLHDRLPSKTLNFPHPSTVHPRQYKDCSVGTCEAFVWGSKDGVRLRKAMGVVTEERMCDPWWWSKRQGYSWARPLGMASSQGS